ncbi:MAG: ABC-type transport auxiliary lipoprotein family protein [Rhodoferax sp.]
MKDRLMNPATDPARLRRGKWTLPALALALALGACALPGPAVRTTVIYDFGPGPLASAAPSTANRLPALVLDLMETSPALDSTAVLYRLAYVDSQQIHPYALARWSMAPAQLVRQRLRQHLGQRRPLLSPGDQGEAGAPAPVLLQLELEEFSQLFESASKSSGLLRLHATLTRPGPKGAKWLAQRSLSVQREAPSADAAGGVQALTAATDAAALELERWLQELGL